MGSPSLANPGFGNPYQGSEVRSARVHGKIDAQLALDKKNQMDILARNVASQGARIGGAYGGYIPGLGSTDSGMSPEEKKVFDFLLQIMSGQIKPYDEAAIGRLQTAATDPITAEVNAGQTYLSNLYGARGFAAGGGGETSSLRELRAKGVQQRGLASQQALIAANDANFNARTGAAGAAGGLGSTGANRGLEALNALSQFITQYPMVNGTQYVPKFNSPITMQANTAPGVVV